MTLNHACLPIPPLRHTDIIGYFTTWCQSQSNLHFLYFAQKSNYFDSCTSPIFKLRTLLRTPLSWKLRIHSNTQIEKITNNFFHSRTFTQVGQSSNCLKSFQVKSKNYCKTPPTIKWDIFSTVIF